MSRDCRDILCAVHSRGARRQAAPCVDFLTTAEVTALSRIPGTLRTQEDTKGHEEFGD